MALVTQDEVKAILPASAADDDVQTFIDTADLLVTEELSSSGLSTSRLKLIEMYLAAHLWTVSAERGGLIKQKIGESEDTFQGWNNESLGLQATRYGQQVGMLDTTGKLTAAAKGTLRAQFRVVGGNPANER